MIKGEAECSFGDVHIWINTDSVPDGICSMCGVRKAWRPAMNEAAQADGRKFKIGDRVTKTKGSSWTGRVVGFYQTDLTPVGYCVESENERGSVQIYPQSALTPKE